jgi:hypothetical protein
MARTERHVTTALPGRFHRKNAYHPAYNSGLTVCKTNRIAIQGRHCHHQCPAHDKGKKESKDSGGGSHWTASERLIHDFSLGVSEIWM